MNACKSWLFFLCACLTSFVCEAPASGQTGTATGKAAVVLVQDGTARLSLFVGELPKADAAPAPKVSKGMQAAKSGDLASAVSDLQRYVNAMSGTELKIAKPQPGAAGIYLGVASDFPWLKLDTASLGGEGFIIKSDGKSLYLIGDKPLGVQHAVSTFLHQLGCRWFFPGKTWEVVPAQKTIAGSWDVRETPTFKIQRHIRIGAGKDVDDWYRHNRMGGPLPVNIGHTNYGLKFNAAFAEHPDWFAEIDGKRKPTKPCYSNPGFIEAATKYALAEAASGASMISMTPPDGLNFCECERCKAVFQGGKPYKEHGTLFAKRPDGVVVNITSETLFKMVNQVAEAVAAKYPKTLLGSYAYSAYSHPPSFKLHPNVFVQTTTAFRRTPMSLQDQLDTFKKNGMESGIRGYYGVYQWDWDYPAIKTGELSFPRLVDDLRFFQKNNVQSVHVEAGPRWGPRGLGYYMGARMMWDVNTDAKAAIADFYDKAFGPASLPMERYYVRWLGPYVAIRSKAAGKTADTAPMPHTPEGEIAASRIESLDPETLKGAYRELDEAARLVKDLPEYRERVDLLRFYAHYLFLRVQLDEAAKTNDKAKIRAAVKNETEFAARIANTNMIYSSRLLEKEFYRRFLKYKDALEGTPEWPVAAAGKKAQDVVLDAYGQGFRRERTDAVDRAELERLWLADKKVLGLS